MTIPSFDYEQDFSVGDVIGDGMTVVAIIAADGARTEMCWCAVTMSELAQPLRATFSKGEMVLRATRLTDPFTEILFHLKCAKKRRKWLDPIVRLPWGVSVVGQERFSTETYWGSTREETRRWRSERPDKTVKAWMRTSSNYPDKTPEGNVRGPFFLEDPANPLCETNADTGATCSRAAVLKLAFVDGPVALVCGECFAPIAAAVPADSYTASEVEKEEVAS